MAVIEENGSCENTVPKSINSQIPRRDNSFRGFSTKVERSAKAITTETSTGELAISTTDAH